MDHHRDLVFEETEGVCGLVIVYLVHILDLEEMIARTEGTLLCPAPLIGLLAYEIGICIFAIPTRLYSLKILRLSEPLFDCPAGATQKEPLFCLRSETNLPLRTDSRRYFAIEDPDEVLEPRNYLLSSEIGPEQPDPSVYVITDSAGRDYPFLDVECSYPPDGETIPCVDVRHRHGCAHNSRECGDIRHLLYRLIFQSLFENFIRIDHSLHPHPRFIILRHLDLRGIYSLQFLQTHGITSLSDCRAAHPQSTLFVYMSKIICVAHLPSSLPMLTWW